MNFFGKKEITFNGKSLPSPSPKKWESWGRAHHEELVGSRTSKKWRGENSKVWCCLSSVINWNTEQGSWSQMDSTSNPKLDFRSCAPLDKYLIPLKFSFFICKVELLRHTPWGWWSTSCVWSIYRGAWPQRLWILVPVPSPPHPLSESFLFTRGFGQR